MEASPSTLSLKHLELMQKYKFKFLSIGIQSLSANICKKENRYYVSPDKLKTLADVLNKTGLYFNFDLICFLDKGDIRDLQAFEKELVYILKVCKPSCVTIHQYYQSVFTVERNQYLIKRLREILNECDMYTCINSELCDEDAYDDTRLQAEYRLVNKNSDLNYQHYMWNKYANMPVEGFNILSLGYYNKISTTSYTNRLHFDENGNSIRFITIDPFLINDFIRIRKKKGLNIPKGFEKLPFCRKEFCLSTFGNKIYERGGGGSE